MNTKPNIVFILADDMGYGDFSAFNGGLSVASPKRQRWTHS